jgi:hypothetical protein
MAGFVRHVSRSKPEVKLYTKFVFFHFSDQRLGKGVQFNEARRASGSVVQKTHP